MKNNLARLIILEKKYREAEMKLENAVDSRWPVGTRVRVRLHSRQMNLTPGSVATTSWKGYVRVKIDTAKENSHRSVRDVHFKDVFGEEA